MPNPTAPMGEPGESEKELPPSLDDPDGMDGYWTEKTTITVDRWVKANLDHDRDGQPWNEYLESLRRLKADPLTITEVEEIASIVVEEIREELEQ